MCLLGWFIFIDEGRFLSITTKRLDTSFNILRSQRNFGYKNCVRVNKLFFEGHQQRWNFESKGQKFYIIASNFSESTFRSREGFFFQSKHGSACKLNLWLRSIITKLVACGNATLVLNIFICWPFLTLFRFLLPLL